MDCDDYVEGHHEEMELNESSETENSQVDSLRSELQQTKDLLQHMEWHCYAYRMALQNVQGGLRALHDAHQAMESSTSPPCHSCEKDALLERIHDLEASSQSGSPIFSSTSVKKRKAMKEKKSEEAEKIRTVIF